MSRTIALIFKLGIILLILSCVSACGQKGNLYLPPKDVNNSIPDYSTSV